MKWWHTNTYISTPTRLRTEVSKTWIKLLIFLILLCVLIHFRTVILQPYEWKGAESPIALLLADNRKCYWHLGERNKTDWNTSCEFGNCKQSFKVFFGSQWNENAFCRRFVLFYFHFNFLPQISWQLIEFFKKMSIYERTSHIERCRFCDSTPKDFPQFFRWKRTRCFLTSWHLLS